MNWDDPDHAKRQSLTLALIKYQESMAKFLNENWFYIDYEPKISSKLHGEIENHLKSGKFPTSLNYYTYSINFSYSESDNF